MTSSGGGWESHELALDEKVKWLSFGLRGPTNPPALTTPRSFSPHDCNSAPQLRQGPHCPRHHRQDQGLRREPRVHAGEDQDGLIGRLRTLLLGAGHGGLRQGGKGGFCFRGFCASEGSGLEGKGSRGCGRCSVVVWLSSSMAHGSLSCSFLPPALNSNRLSGGGAQEEEAGRVRG